MSSDRVLYTNLSARIAVVWTAMNIGQYYTVWSVSGRDRDAMEKVRNQYSSIATDI